jgi:hypothetical protein
MSEADAQQSNPNPIETSIAAGQVPALTPQPSQTDDAPQNAAQPSAPAPAPRQATATPAPDPNAPHTLIGKFFNSLKGGGTGSSASQLWRSIIGGAIVGMGAADAAPPTARGPYGDVPNRSIAGAASRGFQAGQGLAQQQQDRAAAQRQRDLKNSFELDDQKLRQAADARAQQASIQNSVEHEKRMKVLDLNIERGNWEAAQRTAKVVQDQLAFRNALSDVGAQPLAGADGQPLQFKSHQEAENAAHDNPKFFIGNFKTRMAYDPETNSYSVYRVPDSDLKDVQLKDPTTGQMHTIPRMSPSDYLDYQLRQLQVKRGALEVQKVGAEIDRLHSERKAGAVYGNALAELTKATDKDGNVDLEKLSAGTRTVLTDHASKGLEDALRARGAASTRLQKAKDSSDQSEIDEAQEQLREATELTKHYTGVLSTVTGNKKPTPSTAQQPGGGLDTAVYSRVLEKAKTTDYPSAVQHIQDEPSFSSGDKQRLIKDLTADALSRVPSDTSFMSNGQLIPTDAVKDYINRHPGITVVGQGTKQSSVGQFGER